MFGNKSNENNPGPQRAGTSRRSDLPPIRKFAVRRYKPENPGEIETITVYGHQLEYATKKGVLAIHVGVEFEEAIVIQVQRVFNEYIDVEELNAALPATSMLTSSLIH